MIRFRQHSAALLIANYLSQQGIENRISESNNEYLLSILSADDQERAKQIIEHFIRNPNDAKYQELAWQNAELLNESRKPNTVKSDKLKQTISKYPIVVIVLVVCALVYGVSLLDGFSLASSLFMIQPLPSLMQSQQWWRLVTPAFIHFSELHIIFNLLWWWMLGRQLEDKFGSVRLTLFLLFTAIISNLAQLLVSGPLFGGLSGVVYALMGFVWWLGWLKPSWGLHLDKPMVGFMLVWLVIGYLDVLWVSMANTAHTAGLISGCLLAYLVSRSNTNPGVST